MKIKKLVRSNIKKLKPYSSARDEFSGEGNYLFFDANENALGSVGSQNKYNRYPDPYQSEMKKLLAVYKKVKTNQIFIGNGSDEAIDLLFRAFCKPGKDKVLILPPTYGMYSVSAAINNIETISVPLTADFGLNTSEIIKTAKAEAVKLIFICSPNNPTGNCFKRKEIKTILKKTKAIVVVDEAYIDFKSKKSMLQFLDDYPNLVVLQTFSKAWGLAGLRLGKAFAHAEIIDLFNKIKPPYNVNSYSQKMGVQALQNIEQKETYVAAILKERKRLKKQLLKLKNVAQIYPSDANFLLMEMRGNAIEIYQMLIEKSIVVRNRSNVQLCENCLRITVGTKAENNKLLKALRQ